MSFDTTFPIAISDFGQITLDHLVRMILVLWDAASFLLVIGAPVWVTSLYSYLAKKKARALCYGELTIAEYKQNLQKRMHNLFRIMCSLSFGGSLDLHRLS